MGVTTRLYQRKSSTAVINANAAVMMPTTRHADIFDCCWGGEERGARCKGLGLGEGKRNKRMSRFIVMKCRSKLIIPKKNPLLSMYLDNIFVYTCEFRPERYTICMNIISILRYTKSLFYSKKKSLITITIDRNALIHNLKEYQRAYPDIQFAPVLKSNAYGHGLIPIACILDKENLPFLIVDSYYEALTLRQNHIKSPILIIGYVFPETIKKSRLKNVHFTITSLSQLQTLHDLIRNPISIHLKIDTGMHRQGLLPSEIHQAITLIKHNPRLKLQGVCSHLADADSKRRKYNQAQLAQWEQSVQFFKTTFPDLKYYHISASAGLLHTDTTTHNLARLGLGLYGISTIENTKLSLKPVLKLTSIISGIKTIKKGDTVGYNNTFTASHDMTIATIPAGYSEGIDRRLSNIGQVEVAKKLCPIIGRISMNITIIDITHIPDIQVGDRVTLIHDKPLSPLSVSHIAEQCDTIPYEILIHIPPHLRREVR